MLLAAYIESRLPGILPVRAPVPMVQVCERADDSLARLAASFEMDPARMGADHPPLGTSGTATVTTVSVEPPTSDTSPGGPRGHAWTLFAQTA